MTDVADDLRRIVARAGERMHLLSAQQAAISRAPGKWSPHEIVGHLIDSASNNHGRFIRAQLTDDLLFPGYDQEAWVRLQQYATADWLQLIALWSSYNLHIAHVIEQIPQPALMRARPKHNLDEIAWQTVPRDKPATLDYFIRDYVAHLEHHLSQIPA